MIVKLICFLFFALVSFSLSGREIVVWTSNEAAARVINEIKPAFEKAYKTTVLVEVLNKDLTSLFKTASLTGKGPDILLWANDVSGELAQSGLIEPIDESSWMTDNFLPVSLKAFKYKGRLYGYPYAVESIVLFYNKKLIKHPPATFEELVDSANKLNDPKNNRFGFLYDFKNFFFSFPVLNAGGGYIFAEKSDGLNSLDVGITGFENGMNFLKTLNKAGLIPSSTDRGIAFEKFKAGQLAFMIDGPWAIRDLNESKMDYGIAVLPKLKNAPPRPFVGVHGFMIRRSSKNKLFAKELIEKYLLSSKGIELFYIYDNRVPTRMDVLKKLSVLDPKLAILLNSAEGGIAMPNIPLMSAVWSAMGKALSLSIDQGMDAGAALKLVVGQIK